MQLLVTFCLHMLLISILYNALPVANLLISEYKWNLSVLLGKCNNGGLIILGFISLNAIYCSSLHMNCLPFLVKSYIGFNNLCNSRQNILRKFTIPVKCLYLLNVVGSCNFYIASNLLLIAFTQTLLSCINIVLPMKFNSV